jgi:exopolyphosphatase/guanosine-5'-triphosphate,3'-diphosphate pyrophosphatase
MDIGGGSTELIFAKDDDIAFATSLRLGAVTLTEKYFAQGYSSDNLKKMTDHIVSTIAPLQEETAKIGFSRAIASSGTAKAIAMIHAKLVQGIELKDVNGYVLNRNDVVNSVSEIQKQLTPNKIKDALGIDLSRAEIITAGATILLEVTKLLKIKEWVVTSFGLREGLVADTFYRIAGERSNDLPDIQWHSVVQFGKRLGVNDKHGLQVSRLALRLLDLLSPICLGGNTSADGKLLKAASYLREAGKFVATPRYHHHSQYLISNTRLYGFTEQERAFTGLLARYQRKGLPSPDHPDLTEMTSQDFKRLRFLAGILRLAAILDRTRQSLVKDVQIRNHGKNVAILLVPQDRQINPEVEIHKARLEIDALEKSWDLKLSFEVSRS